ncbi:MAG: InlB B-repeat-containing protein [Christensenellales bacterium]
MTHRGGGVSPSTKTVKLGDNYGDLPTPTRTGYSFNNWQTSDGTTVTSTTQNTTIGDHTLTASWTAKSYSVSKGANIAGVTVTVNSSGTFDSALSISTSGSASGYDYTFTDIKVYSGTSTSGTLLATYTSTSATFTMTGTYYDNIYVYASWSRTAKTYTVTKGSNLTGTSVSVNSTGTFDSNLSISSSGSATGYNYSITNIKVFSGSNTSGTLLATYTSTSGTFKMTGTYYSSIYVYATWTRSAKTYTITLDRQSGSGGSSSATATYNATLPSISIPSRAGYTFGGYYTGTGGSGTQYYNSSGAGTRSWTTDGGATLYANWSAIPTTISASSTSVRYYPYLLSVGSIDDDADWEDDSGSTTIIAGGGGGKWVYSVVSTSRSTTKSNAKFDISRGDPSRSNCYSLSTTSATTGSVTLTCSCIPAYTIVGSDENRHRVYWDATYTYVIRATSVYNNSYADITISFVVTYYTQD